MSSISSINSSTTSQYAGVGQHRRPDPSKMVDDIFSKLDTKNQGYLEKSDLESALSSVGSASSSGSASADDVFSALDGDGDGKVTKEEMSSSLQKLADELDSQFNQSRMSGAMGGMPPPPPGGGRGEGEDQGMTLDQMQSVADSTSDSKLSELLNSVASNFDAADANSDGKVTQQEAMAYQQSQQTETGNASASSSADSSASSSSEAAVLKRIMELVHSYGDGGGNSSFSQLLSSISTSA